MCFFLVFWFENNFAYFQEVYTIFNEIFMQWNTYAIIVLCLVMTISLQMFLYQLCEKNDRLLRAKVAVKAKEIEQEELRQPSKGLRTDDATA